MRTQKLNCVTVVTIFLSGWDKREVRLETVGPICNNQVYEMLRSVENDFVDVVYDESGYPEPLLKNSAWSLAISRFEPANKKEESGVYSTTIGE